jgi:subtilisin family serine protease
MRIAQYFVFLVLFSSNLFSQSKYWIFFDELHTNPAENQKLIENKGITLLQKSIWLNSFSANLSSKEIDILNKTASIKKIEKIEGYFYKTTIDETENLDVALKQMGSDVFTKAGLSGKNIKIGVIDAGFYGAAKDEFLKTTFQNQKIVAIKDYLNPTKTNHFDQAESGMDYHGAEVLTYIAGYDSTTKMHRGLAPNALFYLARTDHGAKESRMEEDNWIAAIEWLHGQGVRLVNSSLGYADGFNDQSENYLPEQMDGKTSRISQFANLAVNQKGMFLVVSAGNEGDNHNWKVVSTPADAVEVMSVGATNFAGIKMGYSSIGVEKVAYLKPNISCFSASGTSFSAPIITGLVANMLEVDSTLTNKEIFKIIEQSGNIYPFPNNFVGNGYPVLSDVLKYIKKEKVERNLQKIVLNENNYVIDLSDKKVEMICIFHKKDTVHVISQKMTKPNASIYEVKRDKNAKFTTIDLKGFGLIEIEWK